MVRPRTLVLNELHWAAERLIWGSRRLQFGFRFKYRSSGLAGLPGPQDVLLPAKKKRGSREQPSPPCQRVTNRLRFRHVGPIERLSRRSQEHRPTIGALEPPQVTPMCLLGGKPLAQRRPSIEQRVIPTGERAKALLPTGDRRENGEPNFNRCRVCTTDSGQESSGLLPLGHITRAVTQLAFSSSIRSTVAGVTRLRCGSSAGCRTSRATGRLNRPPRQGPMAPIVCWLYSELG